MRKYTYNKVVADHELLPITADQLLTDKELQQYNKELDLDEDFKALRECDDPRAVPVQCIKVKVLASEVCYTRYGRFTKESAKEIENF